jgi:hypothetical protein
MMILPSADGCALRPALSIRERDHDLVRKWGWAVLRSADPAIGSARYHARKNHKKKPTVEMPWITTATELLTLATRALPASTIAREKTAPATTTPGIAMRLLRGFYTAVYEAKKRRARHEYDRIFGQGALERALRERDFSRR